MPSGSMKTCCEKPSRVHKNADVKGDKKEDSLASKFSCSYRNSNNGQDVFNAFCKLKLSSTLYDVRTKFNGILAQQERLKMINEINKNFYSTHNWISRVNPQLIHSSIRFRYVAQLQNVIKHKLCRL